MNEDNTPQNPTPAPTQMQPPVTPAKKSNKFVYFLLLLLVAGVAFATAYIWQNSQLNDSEADLSAAQAKIAQLEQQANENEDTKDSAEPEETASSDATNPDLIPGDTDTRRDDGRILVTAVWKRSLVPTAVWIEYGTEPTKLDVSTTKMTSELTMGDGEYSRGYSVSIDNDDLTPGTTYYYRVAATINGQTQRSAVASFVTDK